MTESGNQEDEFPVQMITLAEKLADQLITLSNPKWPMKQSNLENMVWLGKHTEISPRE